VKERLERVLYERNRCNNDMPLYFMSFTIASRKKQKQTLPSVRLDQMNAPAASGTAA
jgi:hypothetical protein